jgi:hypothetical protein
MDSTNMKQKVDAIDITNTNNIRKFISIFAKDDNWHNTEPKSGNLGYGFIHYSLIRNAKPKNILIIGSKYGFIPGICALACKDNIQGKVDFIDASYNISVDSGEKSWGGVGHWKTKIGKNSFSIYGLKKFISIHITTSRDFAHSHQNKKWDYIYADGDHSYEGAFYDFHTFYPKLKENGYFLIHDINSIGDDGAIYGVNTFWHKHIKNRYHNIEIPGKFGLGIIQKPKHFRFIDKFLKWFR